MMPGYLPEDFAPGGYLADPLPEISSDTENWLVRKLTANLLNNERTVAEVAEYCELEWDAALADARMEEYEGRITEALAARIVCGMLQAQVGDRK